jgi:hypothetical protein
MNPLVDQIRLDGDRAHRRRLLLIGSDTMSRAKGAREGCDSRRSASGRMVLGRYERGRSEAVVGIMGRSRT